MAAGEYIILIEGGGPVGVDRKEPPEVVLVPGW